MGLVVTAEAGMFSADLAVSHEGGAEKYTIQCTLEPFHYAMFGAHIEGYSLVNAIILRLSYKGTDDK